MSRQESYKVTIFREWLTSKGGSIDPNVAFDPVPSGFNVIARDKIAQNTSIVSCPFSLAVTPELARQALVAIFQGTEILQGWNERQLVCTYISLHWVYGDTSLPPELEHRPYIDILPDPSQLRTSTYFTNEELEAFRGTNLHGATIDRINLWQTEWEACVKDIRSLFTSVAEKYLFEYYQRAATYLSSRAFPSTLLSKQPSLISQPDSYPVLLPGVDSLNHARGQPVSWVVSHPEVAGSPEGEAQPSISLVIHTETPAGAELFNNYGLKPNSELILGYGFTLHNNPDDTIVLKIGGPQNPNSTGQGKWEVGMNARGMEPVWEAVKVAVKAMNAEMDEDPGDVEPYEEELWASELLTEMAEGLLSRLPSASSSPTSIRPEVRTMLQHYVEGQRDILTSLVQFAKDKEESAIEEARGQGIELV
ncbi:SET domain-containing protein [Irpex lacteus]|nr:SET domain-containing protein [Irpex lacteus]